MSSLHASYLFTNATVFTAEEQIARPGYVAVAGNEIAAVGLDAQAGDYGRWIGPETQVVDCAGRFVMPGFNDSHLHLSLGAVQTDEDFCVDLMFVESEQDCARKVAEFAQAHPQNPWIYGCGWYSQAWEGGKEPSRASLDALGLDRPVCLSDFSMHIAWLNGKALELLGITCDTPDPHGGVIRRGASGEPTGILCEPPATNLALDIVLDVPDLKASLAKTMARFNALGITSVGDMFPRGVMCEDVYGTYQQMADAGESSLRISFYPSMEDIAAAREERRRHHGDLVRCAGVKYIMDGCVEAYTAFMHEPYLDSPQGPGDRGTCECAQDELDTMVAAADRAGLPARIHAIGDAAATMVVDACGRAVEQNGAKGTRFVIEHTDNLRFADIARMKELGISAAVQPQHPIGGFGQGMYERALGEARTRDMWRYRQELDGGVRLGLGTDWPAVMSVSPMDTVYAAVTRSEFSGEPAGGYYRNNALTLGETLQAHTLGSAFVESFEHRVGTLVEGKLADLVVLDRNPFELDPMELRSVAVDLTMFDGRVVYER